MFSKKSAKRSSKKGAQEPPKKPDLEGLSVRLERLETPETKSSLELDLWEIFTVPDRPRWGPKFCAHRCQDTFLPYVTNFGNAQTGEYYHDDFPVEVVGRLVFEVS